MYRIAICDNDPKYRKRIINLLEKNSLIRDNAMFYEYETGEALLRDKCRMHDLLFLDIQIPDMNGNEIAKRYREVNRAAVLIFCTSYQKPTIEVFKAQPYRYIIKEPWDKMLGRELEDILEEMLQRVQYKYLNILTDGKLIRIPINAILYISVLKRGATIHLYSGIKGSSEIICRQSVKELYEQIRGDGFAYAHYSYIVNLSNIIQVNKTLLTLKDNTKLSISRSRKLQFDQIFSEFLNISYKRRKTLLETKAL